MFFTDEDMVTYDTNLKVNLPLRTKKDSDAIKAAILDGTVDCVTTHHQPQEWDSKTCEFEYAKNGMLGLQTAFTAVNTVLPELSVQHICSLFSLNARRIFNLPLATIAEEQSAELTLFTTDGESVFTKEEIKSKSSNSAFIGKSLKGKVIGIYSKGSLILNK